MALEHKISVFFITLKLLKSSCLDSKFKYLKVTNALNISWLFAKCSGFLHGDRSRKAYDGLKGLKSFLTHKVGSELLVRLKCTFLPKSQLLAFGISFFPWSIYQIFTVKVRYFESLRYFEQNSIIREIHYRCWCDKDRNSIFGQNVNKPFLFQVHGSIIM